MTKTELTNAIAASANESDILWVIVHAKENQILELIDKEILNEDWFTRWIDIRDELDASIRLDRA